MSTVEQTETFTVHWQTPRTTWALIRHEPKKTENTEITNLLLGKTPLGHVNKVLDLGRGEVGLARPRHSRPCFSHVMHLRA